MVTEPVTAIEAALPLVTAIGLAALVPYVTLLTFRLVRQALDWEDHDTRSAYLADDDREDVFVDFQEDPPSLDDFDEDEVRSLFDDHICPNCESDADPDDGQCYNCGCYFGDGS